ncbi:MAG: hypothetical protein P1U40_00930 [Coxiellaceae bacterium]|nr:hypothetical protein [Coxiellaceae bacterium]
MSRPQFDQINIRAKAKVVSNERVQADYAAHNALIKIIWSGFGTRHTNRHTSSGVWDTADWDYIIAQLRDPANNRPVYGSSRNGGGYHYTKMGDERNRSIRFDPVSMQWGTRHVNVYRGMPKPGKLTIKAGHYTLLPPHGRMTYCRGIDPVTGILAKPSADYYQAASRSFPGRQIGWLFSANPTDGGVLTHCSTKDMYGRRLPWLGGERAVRHAMRSSVYAGTAGPRLISVDQLRSEQKAIPTDTLSHNDCRYKASLRSATGIVIPGSTLATSEGLLGGFNAVHKKLYVLHSLGIDLPVLRKSPYDADIKKVSLKQQWIYLLAAFGMTDLFNATKTQLMTINQSAFHHLVSTKKTWDPGLSDQEYERQTIQFILHCYGLRQYIVHHQLDNPELLRRIVAEGSNYDAVYAMVQCGASIEHPDVINHLVQRWQQYRQILDLTQRERVIQHTLQHQLASDLVLRGKTKLIQSLSITGHIANMPPPLQQLLNDVKHGNQLGVIRCLFEQQSAADPCITVSDELREMLFVKSFFYAVTTHNIDWINQTVLAQLTLMATYQIEDGVKVLLAKTIGEPDSLTANDFTWRIFVDSLPGVISELGLDISIMQPLLLNRKMFSRLPGDYQQQLLASGAMDDDRLSVLTAQQFKQLFNTLEITKHAPFLVKLLLHSDFPVTQLDDELCAKVTQFIISPQFNALSTDQKRYLIARYTQQFELYVPFDSSMQFNAYCERIAENNPAMFSVFIELPLWLDDEKIASIARHIKPAYLQQFSVVINYHCEKVSALSSLHFRQRKAIMALTNLTQELAGLTPIYMANEDVLLPTEQRLALVLTLNTLEKYKMSRDLKLSLRQLRSVMNGLVKENCTLELGTTDHAMLAELPINAFDTTRVDRAAHLMWRKRAYDYFKLTQSEGSDEQSSVNVYACGVIEDPVLLMGLDRASGYAIKPEDRGYTKQRVICSNAQLFQDEDRIIPISIASMVAPNLRIDARYGNVADRQAFVTRSQLNKPRYYQAMLKTWALGLYALNQQAAANGKNTIMISPLLGGGAYLDGQPQAVVEAAIVLNLKAMIDAYNAQPQTHLPELHICLPSLGVGERNTLEFIDSVRDQLPAMKGRLVLSQSDIFEMSYRTAAKIDHATTSISLVNPASDHVPGGGCYRDMMTNYMRQRFSHANASKANCPGEINTRPMAFEEQLAHVTNFMYSQSASMNPEHLLCSRVHEVKVNEVGVTDVTGRTLATGRRDRSVLSRLVMGLKHVYPRSLRMTMPEANVPVISAVFEEKKAEHVSPQPVAMTRSRSLPTAPHRCISSAEFQTQLLLLISALKHGSSSIYNLFHGDKFSTIRRRVSHLTDITEASVKIHLAEIIKVALTARGVSSITGSGGEAVLHVNGRFAAFGQIIKQHLGFQHRHVEYEDLQRFADSALLAQAERPRHVAAVDV